MESPWADALVHDAVPIEAARASRLVNICLQSRQLCRACIGCSSTCTTSDSTRLQGCSRRRRGRPRSVVVIRGSVDNRNRCATSTHVCWRLWLCRRCRTTSPRARPSRRLPRLSLPSTRRRRRPMLVILKGIAFMATLPALLQTVLPFYKESIICASCVLETEFGLRWISESASNM